MMASIAAATCGHRPSSDHGDVEEPCRRSMQPSPSSDAVSPCPGRERRGHLLFFLDSTLTPVSMGSVIAQLPRVPRKFDTGMT